MASKNPPASIHPLLVEANPLLLVLHNLKMTANEAVALWARIEHLDPSFAGIGTVETSATVNPENAKLWDRRVLYLWTLEGGEGSAGIPERPSTAADSDEGGGPRGAAAARARDRSVAGRSGSAKLSVPDFWCRLYAVCTLSDRARQLRFVFKQLQLQDPDTVSRHGDVVHKKQLMHMVTTMHGEVNGPKELEKMLSYVTLDERQCVDLSAFVRLNTICKSLVAPLETLRRVLRKEWLGPNFWAKHDRHREAVEAEKLKDMAELMRSGYFSQRPFDYQGGDGAKPPMSLKAIRAALAAKKAKEKRDAAAAAKEEVIPPVGERSGAWWKEHNRVRRKKRRGKAAQEEAAKEAASTQVEVETTTADVLIQIKLIKLKAKTVMKAGKKLLTAEQRERAEEKNREEEEEDGE